VPLLAHLADQEGRKRHRLSRGVVERPECVPTALAGRDSGVKAHTDHVDDLVLLPDRHAGEAYVRQKATLVDVDFVLDDQLLRLAPSDVGLGLVVRHDELDGPAVDAA